MSNPITGVAIDFLRRLFCSANYMQQLILDIDILYDQSLGSFIAVYVYSVRRIDGRYKEAAV